MKWDSLFDKPGGEPLTDSEKALYTNGYNKKRQEIINLKANLKKE